MLIGEVARLAGMSKDGVRHYEELGLITSTPRAAGQRVYREYDTSVLAKIDKVRQMQKLGFALKDVAPLSAAYEASGPVPQAAMIAFLEYRLGELRGRISDLQEIEQFLQRKIDGYRRA